MEHVKLNIFIKSSKTLMYLHNLLTIHKQKKTKNV